MVQAVGHETGKTQSQDYYNGRKESEVKTARNLLEEGGLLGQKISLDALHCKPKTLEPIVKAKGIYLVGLKGNQKELFNQMQEASQELLIKHACSSEEKGHGRRMLRKYEVYDIEQVKKAERWTRSKISTLLKVTRRSVEMKTGKETEETRLLHLEPKRQDARIMCGSPRSLASGSKQSRARCDFARRPVPNKKKNVSQLLAEMRTLVILLLKQKNCSNHKAQLEDFGDDFESLLTWLKKLNFL